ncbi:methyltransferase [Sphingomonas sp. CJ20]
MASSAPLTSHVRTADEADRQRHEAVLTRLGIRHWAAYDRDAVALAHEAHLRTQSSDADYHINDLAIRCPAGVYHATYASSSTFVLRHLGRAPSTTPPAILEVGIGSGAILLGLTQKFGPGRYVGVDISELAVTTARDNARRNALDIDVRNSDLFAAIAAEERFDTILFNAPLYDAEPRNSMERHMLCDPGGRILARFVQEAPRYLAKGGAAYVTVSNIGLVAPLDRPEVAISLAGAELFGTGVVRALVRMTETVERPEAL